MMAGPVNRMAGVYAAVVSAFFTLIGCGALAPQSVAAPTERVVTNFRTGLAISGFDPVAYFTSAKPVLGKGDVEAHYAGTTWRFSNAGNRVAFVDNPEVYMPVFGGYDPTGVSRGVAVAGHPEIWIIANERLYLFRNDATREEFAGNPDHFLAMATRNWPAVQSGLVH